MCSSSMIHDALGPSCLPAPTFCGLWRDEIEPITGQPWTWAWEFQENWWKLQTFAWPISLHDPSCGSQTSYDPSFQHLHQATFLWPGTQVQLASMSSCEPRYLFTQVWGIGLAGLQVLTSELRIPNPKNRFPSPTSAIFGFVSEHSEHLQHSATLELTLELAATSLPHCVSTRIIGTTRASTAKGDPTIRNFETSKHWDHKPTPTLWRTLASFQIRGNDAITTCTQARKPQDNAHTHTHNRDCECSVARPEKILRQFESLLWRRTSNSFLDVFGESKVEHLHLLYVQHKRHPGPR